MLKYDIIHGFQEKEYEKDSYGNYIIPLNHIPKNIKFHKLTKNNPNYYDTPLYQALKTNIENNGYDANIPILIYRGKIVDGWHRVTACKEIGLDSIIAKELPYKMALKDVEALVIRLEVRRQMTKTQLAIKAWKGWKICEFRTKEEASNVVGISVNSIKAVDRVVKEYGTNIIEKLYAGEKVEYGNGLKQTDSVSTIKAFIDKKNKHKKEMLVSKLTDTEVKEKADTLWAVLSAGSLTLADSKKVLNNLYTKISILEEKTLKDIKNGNEK